MTVVSFASVKGAPGVTTLSCLVAAAWPEDRRVLLVEGDPGGGDLAARFRLSAKRGWASYAASSRRLEGVEPIAAHLQQLPGGLEVMVSGRSGEPDGVREVVVSLLASIDTSVEARCDVIADIGRLLPGECGAEAWLERSTVVAVVVRRDAPSVLHLRDRAAALRSRCRGGVGLVVIGTGPYSGREIEEFTGMPVLGELPDDPDAAEIAGGRPGRASRLSRSMLVMSAHRLAGILSSEDPLSGRSPTQSIEGLRAPFSPSSAEETPRPQDSAHRGESSGPERPKHRTTLGRMVRRPLNPSTGKRRLSPDATVDEVLR